MDVDAQHHVSQHAIERRASPSPQRPLDPATRRIDGGADAHASGEDIDADPRTPPRREHDVVSQRAVARRRPSALGEFDQGFQSVLGRACSRRRRADKLSSRRCATTPRAGCKKARDAGAAESTHGRAGAPRRERGKGIAQAGGGGVVARGWVVRSAVERPGRYLREPVEPDDAGAAPGRWSATIPIDRCTAGRVARHDLG